MSYFGTVKVSDINGNVVELMDVDELLRDILTQLKVMNIHLESLSGEKITEEDVK